jgi:hypothetical protein
MQAYTLPRILRVAIPVFLPKRSPFEVVILALSEAEGEEPPAFVLDTLISAIQCNIIPSPSAKVCRHSIQRYSASQLGAGRGSQTHQPAEGILEDSKLLNVFRAVRRFSSC